jgi:hypothetical protein
MSARTAIAEWAVAARPPRRDREDAMRLAAAAAIAAGVGCIAGSAAVFALRALPPSHETLKEKPVWSDAGWPFPQDQWNAGRAFVCQPADCGVRVDVFLRPKIGFCNCSTGVSDDAELERISDTALLSREAKPLGSGRPIKVAWMDGRSRTYLSGSGHLLSVAFNDECDAVVAVVAVARLENGDPAAIEPAVLELLNTRPVVLWTKRELGLEFVKREW